MRSTLLGVAAMLVACSGDKATDAPVDAGASIDADAATTPCISPISGDVPFGVVVSGSGPVTKVNAVAPKVSTVHAEATLYFPSGRIPGGEVVITNGSLSYAALDASRSARIVSAPPCGEPFTGFSGTLLGPSDGIDALATVITSGDSDAIASVSGPVKLCVTGAPPAQMVRSVPATIAATESFSVDGTRPFSRESLATIRANPPVALEVKATPFGVRIAASAGAFPLLAPTTIDLSGLRDVLGEPLGLGSVTTTVPTEPIADYSFATEPPATSYVGSFVIYKGALVVGGGEYDNAVALALGGYGKTTLRARHRLYCEDSLADWRVSVVSVDGKKTALAPKCAPDVIDEAVALAGTGPFALHVVSRAIVPEPCNAGRSSGPSSYLLDELSFE